MICPKCKKLIEDGSDYCIYCGTKLTKEKDEDLRPLREIPKTFFSANPTSRQSMPHPEHSSKVIDESRAPFWAGVVCIVLGIVRALFGSFVVIWNDPYREPGFWEVISSWLGDSSAGINLVLASLGVIIIMLWKKKE